MTSSAPSFSAADAPDLGTRQAAFAKYAWGILAYTMCVILFGAVVRITGSGAGCGQHWPTCQGEVVHLPKTVATAIELSHRLTSGLSLLLVVGMAIAAFRRFPRGHATRRVAVASVVLMLTESLVGAALVLLRLVGENTSGWRAVVMAVHLVNTSFLAGAIALSAWTATHAAPRTWRPKRPLEWTLLGTLGAALLVSITGAVTALGDTLYPVAATTDLAARLAADHSATASFLERGRAIHPLVAFTAAAFILATAFKTTELRPSIDGAAHRVIVLVFAQVLAGALNVTLSAPGWMQVVHLALATSVWLSLVILFATTLASRAPTVAGSAAASAG
jgi:heme A synthase